MEETVIVEENKEETKKRSGSGRHRKPEKPKKSRKGLIIALAGFGDHSGACGVRAVRRHAYVP